jgi:hypothetical protein
VLFVKWGNVISEGFTVNNGVRQGSVLSPYLFCVYIDSISTKLNNLNIGCQLGDVLVNHLFYADDICLFCPSSKGLQFLLNVCHESGLELQLIFNKSKCKVLIFKSKSFKNCISCNFRMGDVTLEECSSYQYLGHFITNDCKDNMDILRQCRSVYAKGNNLIRNFHKCTVPIKALLFKMYCGSLYTAQLWSHFTSYVYKKLAVAYHGVFKKMLNLPRWASNSSVFASHNVPSFQEVIRRNVYSFYTRVTVCNNRLVANVINNIYSEDSTLQKRWHALLH